ncbi:hypothetical protein F3N42_01930 [Marinihelvus fidelis]|uniref:Glycosyl transferase CAP10 domain-containing protein n=1 Tax=Marinihelvus fidelis TaxID=2613842 RepID=A0A5N0TDH7_9GAMM|nr:glycosyl transferase family 90 [Marinihelvus fidelis]KAA9133143.1 hypothetical protein F3N42_01930 [Marinihelvus fidelis]
MPRHPAPQPPAQSMAMHEFMLRQACPPPPLPAELAGHSPWTAGAAFFCLDTATGELAQDSRVSSLSSRDAHPFEGGKPHRSRKFLQRLPDGVEGVIAADFSDARRYDADDHFGRRFNVFQYNRWAGSESAVLWRLPGYFCPNARMGCAGPDGVSDTIAFTDKRPTVYWRGNDSGYHWTAPGRGTTLRNPGPGADEAQLDERFSRFRAVRMSRQDPGRFDFRFASPWGRPPSNPLTAPWFTRAEPREAALAHRYILCPNGNDVCSQLYWILNTNSVAFREDCDYEVVPDYFLAPWVHYVPISRGLDDLADKLDYCESNPGLCLRIIENARQAYAQMTRPRPWREAELTVLSRMGLLR